MAKLKLHCKEEAARARHLSMEKEQLQYRLQQRSGKMDDDSFFIFHALTWFVLFLNRKRPDEPDQEQSFDAAVVHDRNAQIDTEGIAPHQSEVPIDR